MTRERLTAIVAFFVLGVIIISTALFLHQMSNTRYKVSPTITQIAQLCQQTNTFSDSSLHVDFDHNPGNHSEIFTFSKLYDGTRNSSYRHNLGVSGVFPNLSPDKTLVVYEGLDRHIHLVNIDGSNDYELTASTEPAVTDNTPVFSPDGKKIAFIRQYFTGGGPYEERVIYLIDTDGTHLRRLPFIRGNEEMPEAYATLLWSPLGNSITYRARGSNTTSIYSVFFPSDQANGYPQVIPISKSYGILYSYSADGYYVSFEQKGHIFVHSALSDLEDSLDITNECNRK